MPLSQVLLVGFWCKNAVDLGPRMKIPLKVSHLMDPQFYLLFSVVNQKERRYFGNLHRVCSKICHLHPHDFSYCFKKVPIGKKLSYFKLKSLLNSPSCRVWSLDILIIIIMINANFQDHCVNRDYLYLSF